MTTPDREAKIVAVAECIHDGDTVDDVVASSFLITKSVNSRYQFHLTENDVKKLAEPALFFSQSGAFQ